MPVLLQIFIILFFGIFVQAGILNFLNKKIFCIETSTYRKSFNIIFFSVIILSVGIWNLYFIEELLLKFIFTYTAFLLAFLFFHIGLKTTFKTTLFENLMILSVQAFCVGLLLFCLGFHKIMVLSVQGNSMSPTYPNQSLFLAQKEFQNLSRGDIVAFKSEQTEEAGQEFIYIKRIVGLPFETLEIKNDGYFRVNGEILEEPYLSPENQKNTSTDFTKLKTHWKLKADEYFVLGDNRMGSLDSRDFGAIEKESILGKFWKEVFKTQE